MGKPSEKKETRTLDVQKKFLGAVVGYSYENQRMKNDREIDLVDDALKVV